MKTIRLDEEAYRRLNSLKMDADESFSSVVKRLVPESGTLGAFLRFGDVNDTADVDRDGVMESAINDRSLVKNDPWAS